MFVFVIIVCVVLEDCFVGFDGGVDDYVIKFFDVFELIVWFWLVFRCSVY